MRPSTFVVDVLSAAVVLGFTSVSSADHNGVWQRLQGLVGKEDHEGGTLHQRDQDAYTNPYGYQPPRPTSSTKSTSSSRGKCNR
jgi:hypothetical protein